MYRPINWIAIDGIIDSILHPRKLATHDMASLEAPSGFPRTNVSLFKQKLIIEMAVAGYEPNDIEVTLSGGTLIVAGSSGSKDEADNESAVYLVNQIKKGAFERRFDLKTDRLNMAAVEVFHKNGVLKIEIPLAESAQPKRLQIAHSA